MRLETLISKLQELSKEFDEGRWHDDGRDFCYMVEISDLLTEAAKRLEQNAA